MEEATILFREAYTVLSGGKLIGPGLPPGSDVFNCQPGGAEAGMAGISPAKIDETFSGDNFFSTDSLLSELGTFGSASVRPCAFHYLLCP